MAASCWVIYPRRHVLSCAIADCRLVPQYKVKPQTASYPSALLMAFVGPDRSRKYLRSYVRSCRPRKSRIVSKQNGWSSDQTPCDTWRCVSWDSSWVVALRARELGIESQKDALVKGTFCLGRKGAAISCGHFCPDSCLWWQCYCGVDSTRSRCSTSCNPDHWIKISRDGWGLGDSRFCKDFRLNFHEI